jgi:non-heme chloroperoxidase
MMIETRDGAHLHVKDMGPKSGEPVVLIHGWPLTGDMWEYQTVALLEAGYRVITYDRRGFGHSAHPADGYDYDRFADDLADVLEKRDLAGVTLVGFSMGGGEVARYLSRHGSARVARAALIASVVPYMMKDDSNPDGVDSEIFEGIKANVRADRFDFLQTFAKQFYGMGMVSRPVSQGVLDWSFLLACMASPVATIHCVDAFARTDFRPDLKSFTMPTLIIHGTGDKIVPIAASARAAAAAITGAHLIEYDGEPHGLFATVPDRLNEDLIAFLRKAGSVRDATPHVREPVS